jgi:hypothetical protein
MGAINESNAIYLNISNGKISRRVQQPTDLSMERKLKDGRVINEEIYKGWQGRLVDIKVTTHPEFGKFWNVTLEDENGRAILQMNYSGGYASAFLKTLPNVDLSKEIQLIPKLTIEGDKKKTTLFINQDGHSLKRFYTKEEPHGLPELQQIKVKGKMQYDDSNIMDFLEKMVVKDILPKLSKSSVPEPAMAGESSEELDDDMPF